VDGGRGQGVAAEGRAGFGDVAGLGLSDGVAGSIVASIGDDGLGEILAFALGLDAAAPAVVEGLGGAIAGLAADLALADDVAERCAIADIIQGWIEILVVDQGTTHLLGLVEMLVCRLFRFINLHDLAGTGINPHPYPLSIR
jgi:hypothetical protein